MPTRLISLWMNPLASRKQLLIAESELNRAQLVEECQCLASGVRHFAGRAKSMLALSSVAVSVVAALAALRRHQPVPADRKPTWTQTILKGMPLVAALWAEFRLWKKA